MMMMVIEDLLGGLRRDREGGLEIEARVSLDEKWMGA